MRSIIFLGASNNIDVFVRVCQLTGRNIAGILDDNFFGNTATRCDIPIIGSEDTWNFSNHNKDYEYFIAASVVPINTDDRNKRLKMINLIQQHNLNCATLIHPQTEIHTSAVVGAGTYIGYCASVSSRVIIGDHCQIHTYAGISHDVTIGSNTALAHQVMIAGHVQIGQNVHIGMGAAVCKSSGIVIGDNAVIHPKITVMRDVAQDEIVHLAGDNVKRIYGNITRL